MEFTSERLLAAAGVAADMSPAFREMLRQMHADPNMFYIGEPNTLGEIKKVGSRGGGATRLPPGNQCVESAYASMVLPEVLPMTYGADGSSLPGAVAHELAEAFGDRFFFSFGNNLNEGLSHQYALMIENTVRNAQGLRSHE